MGCGPGSNSFGAYARELRAHNTEELALHKQQQNKTGVSQVQVETHFLGKFVGCARGEHKSGVNVASCHEKQKGLTGLVL